MTFAPHNPYQTLPLPDGKTIQGAFPTIDWFKRIGGYTYWKGKRLIDVGCCQGSFCIQALNEQADHAYGVDIEEAKIVQARQLAKLWGLEKRATYQTARAEDATFPEQRYTVLISMLLHWIVDPKALLRHYLPLADELLLIWRAPQGRERDIGWRPTIDELDEVIGSQHTATCKLSSTEAQNIQFARWVR